MVSSGGRDPDPGGPDRRPGRGRGRRPPEPRQRNPPQIQVAGVASPIEERPEDYQNADAVFTTGGGGVESYHYQRQPTYREQYAAESAQTQSVPGPGQGAGT